MFFFFFFTVPAPSELYTLSTRRSSDLLASWALFIGTGMIFSLGLVVAKFTGEDLLGKQRPGTWPRPGRARRDRKSTRLNSSHSQNSYAVLCLKKKNTEMSLEATSSLPSLVCCCF